MSWIDPKQVRPLKRREYDQLVDAGVFEDEKIELLHGFLIAKEPQGSEHADTTRHIRDLLLDQLRGRALVYEHSPFAASDDSEPEPDISVVPPRDYRSEHPSTAFLVVEVAMSSGRKDRGVKADLYATAGIPEYWLVDLVKGVVERRTTPRDGRYEIVQVLRASDRVSLVSFPEASWAVREILRSDEPA